MALEPAVTDLAQLQERPEIAKLNGLRAETVRAAKLDRGELTVWIDREPIVQVLTTLRDDPTLDFKFLADITGVDWYPAEPRLEVVYHLLSLSRKQRVRIKVRLDGDDPNIESVTPYWPAADFFEREVYDLFGVRFQGHPNLQRIMMPEDWKGHPLRKDYPVEGYR